MRKNHSKAIKAKVVLESLKEELTSSEISSKYNVHVRLVQKWRKNAIEGLPELLTTKINKNKEDGKKLIDELYKQIGQLKVENEFLKKNL